MLITLVTLVVLFLTLGICSMSLSSRVYNGILTKELTITNDSTGYTLWKETPVPMYLNVYFFNWTNAHEVIADWSIKPVFEEMGPYVFSEHHIRTNLRWQNDNHTVTYYQKRIWKFLPDLSNGTLRDNVTNLNVVAVAASYLVRKQLLPIREIVSFILNMKEKSLVLTKTVDELLFTGYEDSLLKMVSSLNITEFKVLTGDRFGWFYSRNNSETYDGNFTMFTGANDIELLGIINQWNGKRYSPYFNDYCAYVNGTSGELWPPVEKYDIVNVFAPDLCSSVRLEYQDSNRELFGLKGKKYAATDFNFDNGSKYPEQKCFILDDKVYSSGVRDISKCKEAEACAQLFASLLTCLDLLNLIKDHSEETSLFTHEHLNFDEQTSLLCNIDKINQYCFYGRCLGFQFCDSMRAALKFISLSMAIFSEAYYSEGSIISKATSSFKNSTKYFTDPEEKAKRLVNISKNADIDFCKAFWFLSEGELMKHLPSVVAQSVAVSKVIHIPTKPLSL